MTAVVAVELQRLSLIRSSSVIDFGLNGGNTGGMVAVPTVRKTAEQFKNKFIDTDESIFSYV